VRREKRTEGRNNSEKKNKVNFYTKKKKR